MAAALLTGILVGLVLGFMGALYAMHLRVAQINEVGERVQSQSVQARRRIEVAESMERDLKRVRFDVELETVRGVAEHLLQGAAQEELQSFGASAPAPLPFQSCSPLD